MTMVCAPKSDSRHELEVDEMRILIAEDETIIRLDLRALLEKAGFEVCAEARLPPFNSWQAQWVASLVAIADVEPTSGVAHRAR